MHVTAIAERVAGNQLLRPVTASERGLEDWVSCFGERHLVMCWKVKDREAQFQIFEAGFQLSPASDGLRRDLVNALRAQFGSRRVQECTWVHGGRAAGCKPLILRDGVEWFRLPQMQGLTLAIREGALKKALPFFL